MAERRWRGALIAFEGIDGSGTTTHSKLAAEALARSCYRVAIGGEPTHGPIGEIIREYLARGAPHEMMALLFAADRVWNLRLNPEMPGGGVLGALREGYVVVLDRYKYSSLAYQGLFLGIDWVDVINRAAPEADILVYLDVPVDVALERLTSRGRREAYEKRDVLLMVREVYQEVLRIAEDRGVTVFRVDSTRDIDTVAKEVANLILEALTSLGAPPSHPCIP